MNAPSLSQATELHHGQTFRVRRVVDPANGGSCIVKQAVEDGASVSALRNEHRILERLKGVDGCPRLVRFDPSSRELVVEDFGGLTLSQSGFLGQRGLERFLALSEALARIVAAIHARGVIHKDLNPANMLIRPGDLQLQIIDFDLATTVTEEHPEFDHPSRLLGTPAYLSPEQTGRMNRPVDYRSDLYSLGATLYALATGSPPFDDTDTLRLIHAHLASSPIAPLESAPWLPRNVSELILALLAKEPDDRYQSAAGLAHDLGQLRKALTAGKALDDVRLKERDLPLWLRLPRRLYGRDQERATLLAAFASVTEGGTCGLFVAGYSGVGKTSLIHEILGPVTLGQGLFISGKFEQFQRDRPLLAPANSLRQLCHMLLAEPEAAVVQWRQRILSGVGPDASALFEVVPELQALLGPQPPAPELGPIEAQVRLLALLVALVRQVAARDRPLVLFLDDLQWADQPSLDFIGALLEETSLNGLLLIGAYRDNEVDATHPLLHLLRQPTASGQPAQVLTLSSLTVDDLAALLADMLHMRMDTVRSLADALYAKTSGNAFFTVEFLNALYRQGSLCPDRDRGLWCWDVAAILLHPASANVVDFLAAQLADLALPTADALVAAACLGNECELGDLALATGIDLAGLTDRLTPALERGIIVTPNTLAFHQADAAVSLRFCHDRMQQAVYQLRDDAWRGRLHLAIARRFVQAVDAPVHQFSAAEHYAAAAPLIVEGAERAVARRLFLLAAVQARQSGSFATAERFLRLGIELLAADAWQSDSDAAFTLHVELHLALYGQSRNAEVDEVYALLAAHTVEPLRLVESTCVQVVSLSNRTRYEDSIQLACVALEQLGMPVPLDDLSQSLERELDLVYDHVGNGALERLHDSPALLDDRLLGAAKLMNRAGTTAYFCMPALSRWFQVRLARLWIEAGYCAAMLSSTGYLICATIALRGDFVTGYLIGCKALATGPARERGTETARTQHVFGLFNSHWFQPLHEDIVHAHAAFDGLLRAGSLDFACYTFRTSQAAMFETCADLGEMKQEVATALSFTRKTANRHAEQSYVSYRQLVRALEGKTARPGSFDDAEFDEQAHLLAAAGNRYALGFFHIYRALAACLFHDDQALVYHADEANALTPHIPGVYPTALANLLHSLALIHRLRSASLTESPRLLEQLAANQTWLAARATDAPMNFAHLHDLVEAGRLDALNQPWEAQTAYEQAMRNALAHQRPWHHALATERAGQFYMRRGLEHAGRPLLVRAHHLYRQWGADGKAHAMQKELPFVETSLKGGSSSARGDVLDNEALLRASQALASETSQPRLVARIVELLGQLTGATDARLLLLDEEGSWHLEGGVRGTHVLERMTLLEAEELRIIATSVLRLGLKTLQPLVSEDAVIDSRFAGDPHFAGMTLCSLLALPIVVRGRISAFLTLEHRLLRAAFTSKRVETVTMLCSQMAISIENVRLYQSLERKVVERTRALEAANHQLEALSATDGLTGIANRRCFDESLLAEWRRAARSRQPLALAMLDVDWFKRYNDSNGHQAGDECLRTVAALLQAHARRISDLTARYGGEEFAFIAPGTDEASMLRLAEAIRSTLESLALPHDQSPLGRVTVSIGVAVQVPNAEPTPVGLLRMADDALYLAKAQGRNRVHLATCTS